MPTYDYRCKECGQSFDEFQSMSADPLVTCPNCSKPALQRVMHGGAGMIFKGSGFYLTDYKKGGGNGQSKSEPKKEPSKEAKSETKKDSEKKTDTPSSPKSEPST